MKLEGAEAPNHAAKYASAIREASDLYGQAVWRVCYSHASANTL